MKSRIGFWIDERGLKRKFIAKQLGVSPEMVSKWVTGKALPRLDKAFELAKMLGIKVDDLYEEFDSTDTTTEA